MMRLITMPGQKILSQSEEVFAQAELLVKVKEPQVAERTLLYEEQTLFTYLHLAPDLPQTEDLLKSGATCIAYETVTDAQGRLPLLAPMSEVAGRMSVQAGAMCLEKSHGGSGILLGGVAGTHQARVLVIGGGVVGQNAAQMAVGLGARVTIIDRSLTVLKRIDQHFGNRVQTLYSTQDAIMEEVQMADLVIGAALVPGAAAPKLVTKDMVQQMRPGSVLVDVAIDQGVVLKPPARRRMLSRLIWWMMSSTIVLPICRCRGENFCRRPEQCHAAFCVGTGKPRRGGRAGCRPASARGAEYL